MYVCHSDGEIQWAIVWKLIDNIEIWLFSRQHKVNQRLKNSSQKILILSYGFKLSIYFNQTCDL